MYVLEVTYAVLSRNEHIVRRANVAPFELTVLVHMALAQCKYIIVCEWNAGRLFEFYSCASALLRLATLMMAVVRLNARDFIPLYVVREYHITFIDHHGPMLTGIHIQCQP
jgi:hypothetical protein